MSTVPPIDHASAATDPPPPEQDPAELRRAFGLFATGVAVVTARDPDGAPLGMTINSLVSLSLSPALLLWSLAKRSRNHSAFLSASHFAIHVLEEGQHALCRQFAGLPEDRLRGVALEYGITGVPLLSRYLARFECRTCLHHDGGDHSIVIGRILDVRRNPGRPLLFFQGDTAFLPERRP